MSARTVSPISTHAFASPSRRNDSGNFPCSCLKSRRTSSPFAVPVAIARSVKSTHSAAIGSTHAEGGRLVARCANSA